MAEEMVGDMAEDMPLDPLTETWGPWQVGVMQALHRWTISSNAINQALAQWLSLPLSDASALSHVVWDAESESALSPSDLGRRMGMSSGATSLLVDRLEGAGLVTRTRESRDRRRVTLRPTATAREKVRTFLHAAGVGIATTLRAAEPQDLETATRVLDRLNEASRITLDSLDASPGLRRSQ